MSDQQIRGYLALFIAGVLAFGLWVVIDSEEATNEKIADCTKDGGMAFTAELSNSGRGMACIPRKYILWSE